MDKLSEYFNFNLLEIPFSYRILIENLVRCKENHEKLDKIVKNIANLNYGDEIFLSVKSFNAGLHRVPAIADLAAMRDKILENGKDPEIINPNVPVSLVIDHSISVDSYSQDNSLQFNVERNFG